VEQLFIFCELLLFLIGYCLLFCTVGVTGLREGGDVRGCLLAAIMILGL